MNSKFRNMDNIQMTPAQATAVLKSLTKIQRACPWANILHVNTEPWMN